MSKIDSVHSKWLRAPVSIKGYDSNIKIKIGWFIPNMGKRDLEETRRKDSLSNNSV